MKFKKKLKTPALCNAVPFRFVAVPDEIKNRLDAADRCDDLTCKDCLIASGPFFIVGINFANGQSDVIAFGNN